MLKDTFIALDVETTGFDAEKDSLIEVAAVRFNRNKTIDTFESFVNPGQSIPSMITHITGIKEEHVASAPKLSEIQNELIDFIGNAPIVGHNISFDTTFLKAKGLPLNNKLYDTLDLSSILYPNLPSYSLDTLTRVLNIEHIHKHRALSDTIATKDLFLLLLEEIDKIPEEIINDLQPIFDKSTWPLIDLFQRFEEIKAPVQKKRPKIKSSKKSSTKLTNKQRQTIFHPEKSPLNKVLESFESRPSQAQISDLITESFEGENHILLEAGTGTGKTLAYLTAAIYFAQKNKKKVVISTYTKTLQDQILKKDIPLLKKALKKMDPRIDFTAIQLKGKENYISLKRVHTFLLKDRFEDHEVTFLVKILMWLRKTETGDLDEVNIQGKEYSMRAEICTQDTSDTEMMQYESNDEKAVTEMNYIQRARQKAQNANIIIVNHALLMQQCMNQNRSLLPEYEHLIIDEAHHVEKVATDASTITLSINKFLRPLESFLNKLAIAPKTNSMPQVTKRFKQLIQKGDIFFGLLGIFIQKNSAYSESHYSQLIKTDAYNSLEWSKVRGSALQIIVLKKEIADILPKLAHELEEEPFFAEILSMSKTLQQNAADLLLIFESNTEERINWTYQTYEGGGCLKSAPLNIGTTLQKQLFDELKSVVLTSSTLTTEKNFTFIKDQLSLDESVRAVAIPSHFDYPEQVKILIPENLPAPASAGYFQAAAATIKEVILKNKGRTLVLFTSKKALTAMYMNLAPELRNEGYELLGQGISGGRGKILQHFKEESEKTAIFGTASFWEGIDIPGDLLTCVIMQKLPFDPPTDPIIAMRGLRYTDSFNEYQLPRAIIKFKQGFGRLIRTAKDKGTMVILDSRILSNSYGRKFLNSLPQGITLEYPLAEKTANFL